VLSGNRLIDAVCSTQRKLLRNCPDRPRLIRLHSRDMFYLRRPARLRLALCALCTLLLAQWTLAAHACPIIGQAAERIAQAQLAQELAQAVAAGCPHHAQPSTNASGDLGSSDHPSPTCLKHCADETPASNGVTFGADAPPSSRPLRVEPAANARVLRVSDRPNRSAAAGPPLIIQYCVSLT
jgi:hypothetical protein